MLALQKAGMHRTPNNGAQRSEKFSSEKLRVRGAMSNVVHARYSNQYRLLARQQRGKRGK